MKKGILIPDGDGITANIPTQGIEEDKRPRGDKLPTP